MRVTANYVLASALLLHDAFGQAVVTPTIVVTTHVSACKSPSSSLSLKSAPGYSETSNTLSFGSTSVLLSGTSTSSSSPTSSEAPVCGQDYSGSNNTRYQIECGQTYGGDLISSSKPVRFINRRSQVNHKRATESTFEDCISSCDDAPSCVAATYLELNCTLFSSITAIFNSPAAQAAIRAEYAESVLPSLANPSTAMSGPTPEGTIATQPYSSAVANYISQKISDNAPVSTSDNTAVYITPDPVSSTSTSTALSYSSLISDYVSDHLSDNTPIPTSPDTAIYVTEATSSTISSGSPETSGSASTNVSPSQSSSVEFSPSTEASVPLSEPSSSLAATDSSSPSTDMYPVLPSSTSASSSAEAIPSSSASPTGASIVYVDRRAAITSTEKTSAHKSSSLHKSSSHKTSSSVINSSTAHISSSAHKSSSTPAVQAKIVSTKKSTSTSSKKTTSTKKTSSTKKTTSTKKTKSTKKSSSTKKATSTKKTTTSTKKTTSTKNTTTSVTTVKKITSTSKKSSTTSKKTSTTSSKKTSTTSTKKTSTTSSKKTTSSSPKATSTSLLKIDITSSKTSSTSSKKITSTSSSKSTSTSSLLKSTSPSSTQKSTSPSSAQKSTSPSSTQKSTSTSSTQKSTSTSQTSSITFSSKATSTSSRTSTSTTPKQTTTSKTSSTVVIAISNLSKELTSILNISTHTSSTSSSKSTSTSSSSIPTTSSTRTSTTSTSGTTTTHSTSTVSTSTVISTSSTATPTPTSITYTCPANDGQKIVDNNGITYTLGCGNDTSEGGYNGGAAQNSFNDCFSYCDDTSGCVAFTYVGATNGAGGGTCYLKIGYAASSISFESGSSGLVGAIKYVAASSSSSSSTSTTSSIASSATSVSSIVSPTTSISSASSTTTSTSSVLSSTTTTTSSGGSSSFKSSSSSSILGTSKTTSSSSSSTISITSSTSTASTTSSGASTTSSGASTTSSGASTTSSGASTTSSVASTPTPVRNTGKRGLAYNQANLTLPYSLSGQNSQVSWGYDWFYQSCSSGAEGCQFNSVLEFVPLLYNNDPSLLSAWPTAAQLAIDNGSTALMSFNEPDYCTDGSACMSINASVAAYLEYMQPFSGQALLGAPAVTNAGSTDQNPMGLLWLEYFIGNCTGCTIDFINLHWYSNKYAGASYLESHINSARAIANGRPIWITEFGLDSEYSYTDAELQAFLQEAMPWLDQQDDVDRYAYFMDAPGILINNAGTGLSGTGVVYNNFTNSTYQSNAYT